jgi:hypothetical protein
MNKPQIIAELEEITGLAEQTDNTYLYNKTKRIIDSLKEIWSMEEFYLLEMQKNIMQ